MNNPGEISVDLYGQLTEVAGTDKLILAGITSTDQLLGKLNVQFPRFKTMKFKIAVDHKIIDSDTRVSAGSKIALLPPFSGG